MWADPVKENRDHNIQAADIKEVTAEVETEVEDVEITKITTKIKEVLRATTKGEALRSKGEEEQGVGFRTGDCLSRAVGLIVVGLVVVWGRRGSEIIRSAEFEGVWSVFNVL